MGTEPFGLQAGLMACITYKTHFASKCAVFPPMTLKFLFVRMNRIKIARCPERQPHRCPGATAEGDGALKQEAWEDILCPFSNPALFSVRRRIRGVAALRLVTPANPHCAPPAIMFAPPVGFRLERPAFTTPLVALRPETLAMLKLPPLITDAKIGKVFHARLL